MSSGELRWRVGSVHASEEVSQASTSGMTAGRGLNVAVVMPAYNEEALEEFLVEIEAALEPVTASLRFAVVDDASTAGPVAVGTLPLGSRVDLIRNETNLGHGPTALRAYAAGLATDPDVVVHVDGDGQFLGRDFVSLLEAAESHDGVVGTRSGRREPWFRRLLTLGARLVTGEGFAGSDPNTPLRLYRASALRGLLRSVSPDSVAPHLHFTVLHERLGLSVRQLPVTHRPRRGVSALGTTWQGARAAAVLPSGRLLRLAVRAVWELMLRGGVRWLLAGATIAAVAAFVVPGFGMALNYDEAYNLQVVTNLLHGHGYATHGALFAGHPQSFDYRITTGPTVMLPVAATAAVLGEHIWVYRIVPTIAFVALAATWWAVGRRLAGPRWASTGGAFAVLGILSLDTAGFVNDSQSGPGTVIGETTATLFLLLAIMLARRPGWAGLLLGLAVMTKVLALVAVPGVVLAVVMSAERSRAGRAVALFGAVATVPALLWQVVRLASLGWSDTMSVNGDFLAFLLGTGTGSPNPAEQLARQISLVLGFGAAVVLLAGGVVAARLASGWRPASRPADRALLAGILVAGAGLEGYWLVLESQHFVRHSFQAGQLLTPLALVALVRAGATLQFRLLRDVTAVVVVVLVATQTVLATRAVWNPPGPSLAEQRQVAGLVKARGATYRFIGISMVPEVTFFRPELKPRPLDDAGGLLVLTGLFGRPRADACDHVLDEHADYILCEVGPSGAR